MWPVYPRWRGEHVYVEAGTKYLAGLSPLARGTLFYMNRTVAQARFIPAGAGNTHNDTAPVSTGAVYPRWRGEHLLGRKSLPPVFGLSPLARGTLKAAYNFGGLSRFIPAGAGNTFSRSIIRIMVSVYPRWRGEHLFRLLRFAGRFGLSPLARGTQGTTNVANAMGRFIPAGAGNTIRRG